MKHLVKTKGYALFGIMALIALSSCASLSGLFSFSTVPIEEAAPVNPFPGTWCAYDSFFEADNCYRFTAAGGVTFTHANFGDDSGTYEFDERTITLDFTGAVGSVQTLVYDITGNQLTLDGRSPLAGGRREALGVFERQ